MPDGNNPLLTESQRETLRTIAENGIDGKDDAERMSRRRIRKRTHDVMTEFPFLLQHLPKEDRRKIFDDPLDAYREHRRTVAEGRRAGLSDEAETGEEMYDGIVAVMALLFKGVGNRGEFEQMLEDAIRTAHKTENRLPMTVDVEISVDRERDRSEMLRRYEEGDLDEDEIKELLQAEPFAPLVSYLSE